MSDSEMTSSSTEMNKLLLVASISTIVTACLELISWVSGLQPHAAAILRSIPMAPSTAVCFIVLAPIGLFEPRKTTSKAYTTISISFISAVMVFCGLEMLQSAGLTSVDVEDLFLRESGVLDGVPLGRMSPLTAALFVLAAGAILLLVIRSMGGRKRGILGHLSGLLGCAVAFSGFTLVLAYLYGTPLLYKSGVIPVAATTALNFVFLGLGVFARLKPEDVPKRYFVGSSVHSQLSRAFVPLVFFAVLLQGALCRYAPLFVDINNALLSALLAGTVAVLAVTVTSKAISLVAGAIVQTEEALRASEKRHRFLATVLEQSSQPFAVAYGNGDLGIVNHSFCDLTGYDEDGLRRIDWREHLTPLEHRDEERRIFEELHRTGSHIRYEKEYVRKDGKRIPVEQLVHVMRDEEDQAPCYCLFVNDLTERRRAQAALDKAGRDWERTFNTFSDLIMVLDRRHRIVRANKAMADAFKVDVKEMVGLSCFELVHGQDHPPAFCPHSKLMADAECGEHSAEVFEPRLGGTFEVRVSPFKDEDGQPAGSVHIIRDISARRQMEETLKQSESMLRSVLGSAPVGVGLVIDRTFKWTNDFMYRMTGYSEKELLGRGVDLLHESDEEVERIGMMIMHSQIASMDSRTTETKWKRKDGAVIEIILCWTLVNSRDVSDGVVFSAQDVTERKKAQREHNKSEQPYRGVFNNAGIGINMLDRDRKLTHANPAFMKMLGYSEDELRRLSPPDITHPDDRTLTKKNMDGIMEGELDSFRIQKRYIRKDGSVMWADLSVSSIRDGEGKPNAAVGVIADISRRKMMETALKESESRLRLIIDSSPIGIKIVKDGKYVYVNPTFARIFGYDDVAEIMELPVEAMFDDESKALVLEKGAGKGLARDEVSHYEVVGLTKDGRPIDVAAWATGINYFGQEASLAFVMDVTESKSLRSQLLHAHRMEAIGTLAGGIAHDFNNLLTVILGYSELIISEKSENDGEYEDLKKIIHAGRTATDLVRQILAFSRKTETKPRPVNLNRQVEQLRKMVSRLIPRTIEIHIRLDPEVPTVHADPAQIDQVMMNLALNARDAMPNGGKLTIETKFLVLDQEYCRTHVEACEGPHVRVTVGDTGVGIERAAIDRIFEPFFTTKKPGEGTGLGLAMVYGIVKSHGGHIICSSEPGAGTTFNIYLPVDEEEMDVEGETGRGFSAIGTGTILLVDDEQFVRDLGKRVL
ncbi:MAG: PAS domain S-box protein, partial [Pseudomonadota bacterium]